jgi:hypothetical protein
MEVTKQNEFEGWAKVEVMGHQTHIGFVTTQVFGTACLFRVDQPEIPGEERVLQRDEYIGFRTVPKGTTVKIDSIPAASTLIGSASIYRLTPCTEAAARAAILREVCRPLIPVGLPDLPALSAGDRDAYFEHSSNCESRAGGCCDCDDEAGE